MKRQLTVRTFFVKSEVIWKIIINFATKIVKCEAYEYSSLSSK